MVFSVVMYGYESWTIKKAEHQRIDAFVVLEKILESYLDSKEIKRGNPKGKQPWIFLGSTDAEAETPIFWPPDTKNQLTGKDQMFWNIEVRRRRRWLRKKWLDGITDSRGMILSKFWEIVRDREAWHAAVHGVTETGTWLSDWTTKRLPLDLIPATVF